MSAIEARAVSAGTWAVDSHDSTIGFAVDHVFGSVRGWFSDFDVELCDGVLRGVARVASIRLGHPNLEAELQRRAFFDAHRHPEIAFESTDFRQEGDRLTVEGEITIKGHTEPIVLAGVISDPTDQHGGGRLRIKLEAEVNPTRFGLGWTDPLVSGGLWLVDVVRFIADLQLWEQP